MSLTYAISNMHNSQYEKSNIKLIDETYYQCFIVSQMFEVENFTPHAHIP